MDLTGKQLIGHARPAAGNTTFHAVDPTTQTALPGTFVEATQEEVDQAVALAAAAFPTYRRLRPAQRADFLDRIAEEILQLGPALIERAMQETALPEGRLTGERGRTVNQLRLFAEVVREGSWVDARIDPAMPERQPLPRADIRQMQLPLGPVAVFGASNFPLAFSVAGGDTASALAAGCPVIVKGHPAHPGTSELVAQAILKAADASGMPEGVFSMVQGAGHAVGLALVTHPGIQAVAFTGSFRGGKALFDAAMQRAVPIPVYAEMGSTNPVFVLPGAMKQRAAEIAQGLLSSVTLGVGQFCTNPGLVFGLESAETDAFLSQLGQHFSEAQAGVMLTAGIAQAYQSGLDRLPQHQAEMVAQGLAGAGPNECQATLFKSRVQAFLTENELEQEVFGPSTVFVSAHNREELLMAAQKLEGHLTATLQGTESDLAEYQDLVEILQTKVGRLIFNGFPTGVEVCHAMVHGGPFPATTDARSTSVGTLAIKRFARPVCYQGFPDASLPEALQNANPLHIWRMMDGQLTQEALSEASG